MVLESERLEYRSVEEILPGKVRTSAKAIIIENNRLLTIKCIDNDGLPFNLLPGGGQVKKETIRDALIRECREEIGVDVIPGDIRYVRDYIAQNHEFAKWDAEFHQVELMFLCRIIDNAEPHPGTTPDNWQTGVEWLDLARLSEYTLYPKVLRELIHANGECTGPIYLGDVN